MADKTDFLLKNEPSESKAKQMIYDVLMECKPCSYIKQSTSNSPFHLWGDSHLLFYKDENGKMHHFKFGYHCDDDDDLMTLHCAHVIMDTYQKINIHWEREEMI